MVNWQQSGKNWPMPRPHAVSLPQGLVLDQHYRHSNPKCEGGFPETLELTEGMGNNRLQAIEDSLQVEGYSYRLRQRRWRVWRLYARSKEGLCLEGYDNEVPLYEYRPGQRIHVSVWDVIGKEFRQP